MISTPMEHVVQVLLQTVPNLTQPQAVSVMMEAHTNGIALVITCAFRACRILLRNPQDAWPNQYHRAR